MSLDEFFNRRYDRNNYNCAHFVSEVWLRLTGEAIAWKLSGLLLPVKSRRASFGIRRNFKRLERPKSPCIAYMSRPGSAPHVGIYLDRRIFHIHEEGVEFMPPEIASRGFERLTYYATCNPSS